MGSKNDHDVSTYCDSLARMGYVTASINYSPDNFGASGHAEYYKLLGEITLPHNLLLDAHVGRQNVKKKHERNL